MDSNIPMYLLGSEHPHKEQARRALESRVAAQQPLVTDAEVLQEILHRYQAIGRPEAIQPAFDLMLSVVEHVFPIELPTVQRAKDLMSGHPGLCARDCVHAAAMEQAGVTRIMTFDRGFDQLAGLARLP